MFSVGLGPTTLRFAFRKPPPPAVVIHSPAPASAPAAAAEFGPVYRAIPMELREEP
jgi:hypothetical protein